MKKILYTLTILSLATSLSACNISSPVSISQNTTSENTIFAGNVSQKQIGAEIKIRFNFDQTFATKASANGTPASNISDIQSARVRLSTSNTDPLAAGNLIFTSSVLSFSGTSQVYTFSNVPAGTYFATVELYSDTGGTTNIIEPVAYSGSTGTTGLTVSSNSATVVSPAMTYSFSDSADSFNLAPQLKNATGASLEAEVTPVNGNTVPSDPIAAS